MPMDIITMMQETPVIKKGSVKVDLGIVAHETAHNKLCDREIMEKPGCRKRPSDKRG